MWLISEERFWAVLVLSYLVFLIFKKRTLYLKFFGIAAIIASVIDIVAYRVLKPFFDRLRPCYQFEDQIRLAADSCGGPMSFPSNHASNSMAIAVFLCFLLPRDKWYIPLSIAGLIGFTRIYLGVHFLGDVLFGFLFGGVVSFLLAKLFFKFFPRLRHNDPEILNK